MIQNKQTHLFIQVAETIKTRIDAGEYKTGDFLPAYKDIADELGISMITVRKAMDILANEGRVILKQGVRTRVAEPTEGPVEIEINKCYRHWVETAKGKKQKHKIELLDRMVVDCPPQIGKILRLAPGEQVERFRRVFSLQDKPIIYLINYARPEFMSRIPTNDLLSESFIESFQRHAGIKIEEMEQRIQAITTDIDLGKILKLNFGAPLIFVQNSYLAAKYIPVAITYMYYHGEHFVCTIKRTLT